MDMSDTEAQQAPEPKVSSSLAEEIAAGIDAATASDDQGADEGAEAEPSSDADAGSPEVDAEPASAPEAEGKEAEPEGDGEEEAEADDFTPNFKKFDSKIVARALEAGFDLDMINRFQTEGDLAAVCDKVESSSGEDAPSRSDGGVVSESDLLSAIPDLDPYEYDEQIVEGFKSLKEITKRLLAENARLRDTTSNDWITTQLDGVKDYTKGDPEKVGAVRSKFEVLKAGYQAAGENVADEVVFSEAAKLVLGSDMEAAKRRSKGNAARKRNGQFVARSSTRKAELRESPVDEVANMLDRKYFAR